MYKIKHTGLQRKTTVEMELFLKSQVHRSRLKNLCSLLGNLVKIPPKLPLLSFLGQAELLVTALWFAWLTLLV